MFVFFIKKACPRARFLVYFMVKCFGVWMGFDFFGTRIRLGAKPRDGGCGWVRIFLSAPVRRFTELRFPGVRMGGERRFASLLRIAATASEVL